MFAAVVTINASAQVDLTGEWNAIRNGAVVAKCSIKQSSGQLEFVIHRQPEERSRGRFINETTIVASDWGEQGAIAEGGNLIRWRNSEWRRVSASGGTAANIGLNGCWNKCAVQLYQEGERVYFTAAWKNEPGEWHAGWVIQRGEGWIRGQDLYLQNVTWPSVYLKGKPGPKTEYHMRLSADGNVLQGYPVIDGQKGRSVTWTRDK